MQQLLLILPILLPVLFWAAYHYHKDRCLPEPISHFLLAFFLGMLAAGISKLLYMSLGPLGLRFDASALAEALRVALALDPATREALARRVIGNVRADYTKELMCDRTLAVYREVLAEKGIDAG